MAEPGLDFELAPVSEPGDTWAWDLVARGFAIRERGERTRFYELRLPDGPGGFRRAGVVLHDVDGQTLYLHETPADPEATEPGRKASLRVRGMPEETVGRYADASRG